MNIPKELQESEDEDRYENLSPDEIDEDNYDNGEDDNLINSLKYSQSICFRMQLMTQSFHAMSSCMEKNLTELQKYVKHL